jgi:hypothetical protein
VATDSRASAGHSVNQSEAPIVSVTQFDRTSNM